MADDLAKAAKTAMNAAAAAAARTADMAAVALKDREVKEREAARTAERVLLAKINEREATNKAIPWVSAKPASRVTKGLVAAHDAAEAAVKAALAAEAAAEAAVKAARAVEERESAMAETVAAVASVTAEVAALAAAMAEGRERARADARGRATWLASNPTKADVANYIDKLGLPPPSLEEAGTRSPLTEEALEVEREIWEEVMAAADEQNEGSTKLAGGRYVIGKSKKRRKSKKPRKSKKK